MSNSLGLILECLYVVFCFLWEHIGFIGLAASLYWVVNCLQDIKNIQSDIIDIKKLLIEIIPTSKSDNFHEFDLD